MKGSLSSSTSSTTTAKTTTTTANYGLYCGTIEMATATQKFTQVETVVVPDPEPVITYGYGDATIKSATTATVPVYKYEDGVLVSTTSVTGSVSASLSAESTKSVSSTTALAFVSATLTSATYNVTSHSLTSTCPTTASFTHNGASHTATIAGASWSVALKGSLSSSESSANMVKTTTTTATYSLLCGTIEMATATQKFTQVEDIEPTPSTIDGYVPIMGAKTVVWNDSREKTAGTVICVIFQSISGSDYLFVGYDASGNELTSSSSVSFSRTAVSASAASTSYPISLAYINGKFEAGYVYNHANGWSYFDFDGNDQYVSNVSLTQLGLSANANIIEGNTTNVDGEDFLVVGGIYFK